jgi:hypothetical protein
MVSARIAALLGLAMVCGCAAQPEQPLLTPVEVRIPIATPVYCQTGNLDKPALPLAALKADSASSDTIRAYAATVAILKGAVRQRDLVIAGCAAPARDEPLPAATRAQANEGVK